ncbi:MAG TPA: site-2 protease family protein [Pyrinomonadaceae bacterium]|nr:site-2 protease family protein [Pyrinomonadaceae bacterium]
MNNPNFLTNTRKSRPAQVLRVMLRLELTLFAANGLIGMTIIVSLIIFTALAMIIHELGHLVAARLCKVPASELGLGLGPRLTGFQIGSIRFNLRAIPAGSFVRLDGTALKQKSVQAQLLVHLGGIIFNLVAGLFTYGTMFGWLNLLVAASNILPLYQHDGWKCGVVIMRALLRRESQPAERVFTFSGGFVSLLLGWAVLRMFV